MSRRVVVTGLGIISPVGSTVRQAWHNITHGISGVSLIDHFDTVDYPSKIAGLVKDFDVSQFMSVKEARKCDLFIQYGIAASVNAIKDSGLESYAALDKSRVGVMLGSGIGGLGTIQDTHAILQKSGPKRVSPFFIPASIINLIAGHVSIMYGYRGPNVAMVSACTTGTHNLGIAARSIIYGDADVVIAGGAEKASSSLGIAGFAAAKALSKRNDSPKQASRPWDKDRDGFVLGDGAGTMVLEEYEHAKKRGATIYAELIGYAMNGDAFHITQPSGDGAIDCMRLALKDAKINPEDIDYINAHGTSTPVGDIGESNAIKSVFGNDTKVAISSTKSMTGHMIGATGAAEAIFSVLAMRDNIAPPTINLDNPGEGCDLDYVPNVARPMPINTILSNSFGFGGTNAVVIFRKLS